MSFSNVSKNTASYSNTSKNSSTFTGIFRHGKELTIEEVQNLTFNDLWPDSSTLIKDQTFNAIAAQLWTNIVKS